jgi:hypothetical protein
MARNEAIDIPLIPSKRSKETDTTDNDDGYHLLVRTVGRAYNTCNELGT